MQDFQTMYLQKHGLPIDGLMEAMLHFGRSFVEKICEQALNQNSEIEFYYASKADQLSDKLSYRFIDHKNQ